MVILKDEIMKRAKDLLIRSSYLDTNKLQVLRLVDNGRLEFADIYRFLKGRKIDAFKHILLRTTLTEPKHSMVPRWPIGNNKPTFWDEFNNI